MELRPSYKITLAGLIPTDWDISCLGDVLTRLSNGAVYQHSNLSGLPVTRIETIAAGMIDMNRVGYGIATRELASYRMQAGDILFSHINSLDHIGKVAIYNGEHPLYHGMNLLLLRAGHLLEYKYLYYWLSSQHGRRKAVTLARQAVSQASINTTDLKRVHIPLPDLSEQRAIAAALSDVDAMLAGLDRLVAKKRDLKQAAMQQLLTGQTRLPGFGGEWEVKTVAELEKLKLVKLSRGQVISKKDINKTPGEFPIYSSSIHNDGLFGRYGEFMFDEEMITWSVDGGGNFFHRRKHKFSVTNVCGFMRIDPARINCRFFALELQFLHSLKSFDYQSKAHPSVVRKEYLVQLPSLTEQIAIAAVLSDMDAELSALENRRDKTRALKQAMMQELLTGRTRLV